MELLPHTPWNLLRSAIIVLGLVYLGLILMVYLYQQRLVFIPSREVSETPETIGLDYEAVEFEAEDGVCLTGWFVPAADAGATVLFCHGNAGNISHRLDTIRILHDLKLNTFIFDYRGYGDSGGKPGETGTYRDAEAAWRLLKRDKTIPPENIVIMGRSLGGAVAAWLAIAHSPGALIIESSFTSIPDMGARLYPWLPVRLLSRFSYSTESRLRKITCPVLVIHSPDDDIVPYEFGRRLFAAANEPKEFIEIFGSHNEGYLITGKPYINGIDRFVSKYVGNDSEK